MDFIVATLTDPLVGGTIVTLFGLAIADLITGVGAAFRTDTFYPEFVAGFLKSHVLAALLPIVAVIVLSAFVQPLVVVAGIAVATYTVQTVASIRDNLALPAEA